MNWNNQKKPALLAFLLSLILFLASPSSVFSKTGAKILDANIFLSYAIINGLIVAMISFVCWASDKKGAGDKSLVLILLADFRITRFSTIGIITLLNSIIIGFFLGASFHLLLVGIGSHLLYHNYQALYGYDWDSKLGFIRQYTFGGSLILLLLTIVFRIWSEVNILVFRVAQKYLSE